MDVRKWLAEQRFAEATKSVLSALDDLINPSASLNDKQQKILHKLMHVLLNDTKEADEMAIRLIAVATYINSCHE